MENSKFVNVIELPYSNAEEIESLYINNAEVSIAPWDIRVLFSEVAGIGNPPEITKILRANIAMNPGHAKALALALSSAVQEYEKAYGEIKMPQSPQPEPRES